MNRMASIITVILLFASHVTFAQDKPKPSPPGNTAPDSQATTGRKKPASFPELKLPYPPQKAGCHHLVKLTWEEIPCASEQYIKEHYMPRPALVRGIESTPHGFIRSGFFTSPLALAELLVTFLSNPQAGIENDSSFNPKTKLVSVTPNAYSIQSNTNFFGCTGCTGLFAVPGIPNSAGQPGDIGWIQFVYQAGLPQGRLCIWMVDVTVANATNNNAGYLPFCVYPPTQFTLTGPGADTYFDADVVGYVVCPPDAPCLITLLANLTTAVPGGAGGWYSISIVDNLGLAGNWTTVSGTILGQGNSSQAQFAHTTIGQTLWAYACTEISGSENAYYGPQPCPPPSRYQIPLFYNLSAEPTITGVTGESNNLTNGPVTFGCHEYQECDLAYVSSVP